MKLSLFIAPLALAAIAIASPGLAQDAAVVPTVENNGLIPPYLIEWLLPAGGIIAAVTSVMTDRALRARGSH